MPSREKVVIKIQNNATMIEDIPNISSNQVDTGNNETDYPILPAAAANPLGRFLCILSKSMSDYFFMFCIVDVKLAFKCSPFRYKNKPVKWTSGFRSTWLRESNLLSGSMLPSILFEMCPSGRTRASGNVLDY